MIINYNDSIYMVAVNQLGGLIPSHVCACAKSDPNCQHHMCLYCIVLVVNCLRRELLDRCFTFLFLIMDFHST
jgi:hypothetical protein